MIDLEAFIKALPVGGVKAVARVLTYHKGRQSLIERDELLEKARLEPGGGNLDDRHMRGAVEFLRVNGVRVCNCDVLIKREGQRARKIFGYYLAASEEEYKEFRILYAAYARTIQDTIAAMDAQHAIEPKDKLKDQPSLPLVAVQKPLL